MARRLRLGMERVYLKDRVIRLIPQCDVAKLLRQNKAVEIYRNGVYMGIRVGDRSHMAQDRTSAASEAKSKATSVLQDEDARRSCVVLSRAEVEAIADRSKSRTSTLTPEQRDARVLRGLPEMDLPERAKVKFGAMFPGLVSA